MHADRGFYSMTPVSKTDWNRIFKGDKPMASVKHYQSDRAGGVEVKGHARGKPHKGGKESTVPAKKGQGRMSPVPFKKNPAADGPAE